MDEGDVLRLRIGNETKYTFSMCGGEVQNAEMAFHSGLLGGFSQLQCELAARLGPNRTPDRLAV